MTFNLRKLQQNTNELKTIIQLSKRFLSPAHKRSLLVVSIWAVVLAIGEMAIAAAVIPYVECLSGNCHEPIPSIAETLNLPVLALFSLIMFLLISVKLAIHAKFSWNSAQLHQKVERDSITAMFKAFMHMDWLEFSKHHQTHYLRRCITTAVDASSLVFHLMKLISSLLLLIILTGLMIWYQPLISLALLGGFSLFSIVMQHFISRWQSAAAERREEALRSYSLGLSEGFASFREVRVYHLENFFSDHLSQYTQKIARNNTILQFIPIVPRVLFDFSVVAVLLIVVTIWQLQQSSLEHLVPALIFYAIIARVMLPAMIEMMGARAGLSAVMINVRLILSELERARQHQIEAIDVDTVATETRSIFKLENVSFRYHDHGPWILNDISVTIEHPQWVAITGPSGVGKSTLLELLSGILRPTSGTVQHQWARTEAHARPRMAYLPQHVALLDGSIEDNIRFESPDGDEQRLLQVLETVQLRDFVEGLEHGLANPVGADGNRLSGGQRQRLALARALFREPDLLLLDEATSGLDRVTEAAILANIKQQYPNMTVVFITHREENLDYANRVLNLADGKLQHVRG